LTNSRDSGLNASQLHDLAEIQQLSGIGFWTLDLVHGELWWSEQIYELFEVDAARFAPSYDSFLEAIHPEDRELVDRAYQASVAEHSTCDIQHRLLRKDGSIRWVRECGVTRYSEDGTPLSSSGSVQDITGLVESEQRHHLDKTALLAAQQRQREQRILLADALSTARMGTWSLDLGTMVFKFTDEFYELLRTSALEQGGYQMSARHYAESFIPAEQRDVVAHGIEAARASTESNYRKELDHPVILADGSRGRLRVVYRMLCDEEGRPNRLVGVNQDITERHEAETALAELNEHLKDQTAKANAMAREAEDANRAKSSFLANMSHEVRTPMNGVLGMTELLLDTELDGEQRDLAKTVYRSAEALLTILDDILDYSKIEAGRLELESLPADLHELTRDVASLFRAKLEDKPVELRIDVEAGLMTHRLCDPVRLRQILSNLLGNAIKFTMSGTVRIALAQQGEGVALTVEDTGVGISEEGLSRLFEPFTQADASTTRRFGGTGLGLVICRRLAQAMGGDIELTSKLGEGSRFRVVLPQLRAVSPPAEGNAAPSSPQPTVDSSTEEFAEEAPSAASDTCSTQDEASTPLHVLLVEDQEINQRLIARILQRQGHEFDLAVNGAEAVERCRNQHYDLVLMDCQMPILDGYAATAAIRAAEAEGAVPQRIIALTANAMSGDRERCIAAGMDDYLSKPIRKAELLEVIHRWRPSGDEQDVEEDS
jgi:PAS domain S-box-containing protein